MGRISRVASALVSVAFAVLTVLFFYGYLTPLGLSPASILGPEFSSMFVTQGYGALVPGGVVGVILFTILSRVGTVTAAARSSSMPSPEDMMKRFNVPGMMGAQQSAPVSLPQDLTRSQFVVLRCFRQGYKNSKEIGKYLSMDKNDVEKETSVLRTNGYLSKDNKLTSKALETLGN